MKHDDYSFQKYVESTSNLNETTQMEKFKFDITDFINKVTKTQRDAIDLKQQLIESHDEMQRLLNKIEGLVDKGMANMKYQEVISDMKDEYESIINDMFEKRDIVNKLDKISRRSFRLKKMEDDNIKRKMKRKDNDNRRNKEIAKKAF